MRALLGTDRLRLQLLAALATGTLATTACGGSVNTDGGAGSAGTGGTSAAGGSSGSGFGGSGSVGGSGFGGSGQGGSGFGGSGFGGSGFGGSGQGGSGFGGTGAGGSAGVGGAPCSEPDDTGLVVCGTPECQMCVGTAWLSCWLPHDVPLWDQTAPPPVACPDPSAVQSSPYSACEYQYVYFDSGPIPNGDYCCYGTMPACPGGRPFFVDGELRVAAVSERCEWAGTGHDPSDRLDAITASALSEAWLADAQLEHASIAAFARLTLELLHLGAPPELVEASQQASLDEIRHARSCFALGSRFAKQPLGPGKLDVSGGLLELDLIKLVETTFEEGCVGETLAALMADEARRGARDPEVVSALEEIARDEARHAELAWKIMAWAIEQGGERVVAAVRRAHARALRREQGIEIPALARGVDRAAWAEHGRSTPEQLIELRRQGFARVIGPCVEALLERSATAAA